MHSFYDHLWSGTQPASERLHILFELSAKKFPNKTAVVFQNESLSYRELNEKADGLCHAILNWAYYDDIIAVSATPGIEMLVSVLAILKSGKAFLPINSKSSTQKIHQIISDSGVRFCMAKESEFTTFSQFNLKVITSDTERNYPTINQKRLGNLAYLMYTSGSTCSSKGVKIEHKALVNYVVNAVEMYSINDQSHSGSYLQLSLTFDASLTSLFVPLLIGKTVVIADTTCSNAFNDVNFDLYKPYDFIKITPLQFNWLELALKDKHKPFCKNIVVGGENLHSRHFDFLRKQHYHLDIINEYGPTEATVGCMFHKLSLEDDFIDTPSGIPIGKAIPGNEIFILNKQMESVGPGEVGEICIGGIQLSSGYLMRPDLNDALFVNHPIKPNEVIFKTGDYATINEEGTAIYLDRAENHIEIDNKTIDFNLIEWELSKIEGVKHCEVVTKLVNQKQRLFAYIMPNTDGIDVENLPMQLSQRIGSEHMPQKFIVVNEWPYTSHGKLNKHTLPIPNCHLHKSRKRKFPETVIEKNIAAVWCNILNIESTDIDTGFFEMGGNHLSADKMLHQIHKLHGYIIDLSLLYRCSSISCLAKEIEKQNRILSNNQLRNYSDLKYLA